MIPCPTCSGDNKNLETRTVHEGDRVYTRRRRQCLRCGRRFTTREIVVEAGYTSDVMIVETKTMETLLRSIVATFAGTASEQATALVEALLSTRGDQKT